MDADFTGVIIEESLADKRVLKKVKIIKTNVEEATKEHNTPWVKQWTLHTVEIPENQAEGIAEELSKSLDPKHPWYADFKNEKFHYIVFRDKVFKVDRSRPEEYKDVTKYGISIGIPDYQLDFSPQIEEWERNSDN